MRLKLKQKRQEVPGTVSFLFQPEEPLSWKPGQFILYRLPHDSPDDRRERRYFTNAAAPFEQEARITTRINPKGSSFKKALRELEPGDNIEAVKVSGDFVMEDPNQAHVFIAGGIGITPYRSILKQLDHDRQPINVTLLYANKTADIVYKQELEDIAARNPGMHINYFIEPKTIHEAAIKNLIPDVAKPTFWVSGPEPMVEALEKMLKTMGVPEEHIKTDFFPGYNWPEV